MKKTLVLGGPGAGKTAYLLDIFQAALDRGVSSRQIAFCSFTNAASDEGRIRAEKKFQFTDDDLPYCRTLHSLCFREMGLTRNQVIQKDHLNEIGEITGERFKENEEWMDTEVASNNYGANPLLTVDHFARTTRVPIRDAWETHGRDLDWYRLERFTDAYSRYKRNEQLYDFTDMLTLYADTGTPTPVKIAIIDEAQDLTPLQWAVIYRAFANAEELYVAGDDDQSVFRWAGAAEDYLLGLDWERVVLSTSHRLPLEIFKVAQSIANKISRRFVKDQVPAERKGLVQWHNEPDDGEIDLHKGTWLLLARTKHQLKEFVSLARGAGVSYLYCGAPSVNKAYVSAIQAYNKLWRDEPISGADAIPLLKAMGKKVPHIKEESLYGARDLGIEAKLIWHEALTEIPLDDRVYYVACLRAGERLVDPPRIRINTMHGAKGMEADKVLLSTDLTQKTHQGYETDHDGEHRVFYVGATRASQELHLIHPRTRYEYLIERD